MDAIAEGRRALAGGDWGAARAAFETALAAAPSPEADDGLGLALWWLDELQPAHRHRAAAYNGYLAAGDPGRAAVIAAWLAREQVFLHGDGAAAGAWLARADAAAATADPAAAAWCRLLRASLGAGSAELAAICDAAVAVAGTDW